MLTGAGIPLLEEVYWFRGVLVLVYGFLGLLVPWFQSVLVSWFRYLKASKIQCAHITKLAFHVFLKYPGVSKNK